MAERFRPMVPKASPRPTAKMRPVPVLDPDHADVRAVVVALEEMEAARADIVWHADNIWAACTRSAKLRKAWRQFHSEGGATAADFRTFIRSGQLRGCVRQARGLRLVVDNGSSCPRHPGSLRRIGR